MTIGDATRKRVRKRANYLREYCHSSEKASAALFAIDHILPRSLIKFMYLICCHNIFTINKILEGLVNI
jgi:hypothetical protein